MAKKLSITIEIEVPAGIPGILIFNYVQEWVKCGIGAYEPDNLLRKVDWKSALFKWRWARY